MARKRVVAKKLWAVWDAGSDEVEIYLQARAPAASKQICDSCEQGHTVYGDGNTLTELCTDVVKYIPGLVAGGPPVQFKISRVE